MNNPVMFIDDTGSFTTTANRNTFDELSDSYGGIGGGITIFPLPDISGKLSEWIEDLQKSIIEKMTKSLSVAINREYRSEYEEHHIGAKKSPNAAQASAILNLVLPGGVEDPLNKVMVKTSIHRRLHTKLYYSFVNSMIVNAYTQADGNPTQQYLNVVSTLGAVRIFIESLNKLSIN